MKKPRQPPKVVPVLPPHDQARLIVGCKQMIAKLDALMKKAALH